LTETEIRVAESISNFENFSNFLGMSTDLQLYTKTHIRCQNTIAYFVMPTIAYLKIGLSYEKAEAQF
jgi:hypothetical protein